MAEVISRDVSPPHGGVDRNLASAAGIAAYGWSPPHGGVDRNIRPPPPPCSSRGRPLTGAWIETVLIAATKTNIFRPLTGAWIETVYKPERTIDQCRPLTGAWIETTAHGLSPVFVVSPPHGGVDRNHFSREGIMAISTSPPHGGVDRNAENRCNSYANCRSPPHGGVDRNLQVP